MKLARLLGMITIGFALWAADPAVGTWKLDIAKSQYSPGASPKSGIATYDETADGLKRTGETIGADGRKTSLEYTVKYDDKDYPLTGSDSSDTISAKRINDRTVVSTLKKSGKVISTVERVVSEDGKTMTLTVNGSNAKGEKIHYVAVYDKQ